MENKINDAVCRYGMDGIFKGAVVGFSGGADSGALLHYLKDKCSNLLAVHVNHMIRGAEADRDEEFCKQVCLEYGVELKVFRVDIPALSKERKQGLEETAREERYRIFSEVLEQNPQCEYIVTAHNANDNAETILFNLARGSGGNGLSGIKPVIGNVCRPLINSTRDEIIKYCRDNNIRYVVDSTNSDTEYTRNRIRHLVLPELMEINPGFLDSCTRLSEILRSDEEYISKEAGRVLGCLKGDTLPKEIALSLDEAVLIRVLKHIAQRNLDYKAVKACIKLISGWQAGKMINLENGITFKVERGFCAFIPTEQTKGVSFFKELLPGVNCIEEINTVLTLNCQYVKEGFERVSGVKLNSGGICGKLYVRSKNDGDCVKSMGMTKKLKKLFNDKHVPSHLRCLYPVICDESGVVAVPGLVARDGAFDKNGDIEIQIYKKSR